MNFREYTPEALREISRRAGIASGEARRAKRAAIEKAKREEIARREMIHEEIQAIRRETRLLLQYKRALDAAGKPTSRNSTRHIW